MALPRCHLVYAVAPEGMSAREVNDLLSAYIEAPRPRASGLPRPLHRQAARRLREFEVRTAEEEATLADPGLLAGWDLTTHALTFAVTGVGFTA